MGGPRGSNKPRLSAALDGLLELLFPICCVACERLVPAAEKGIVCGHCWSRVRELPDPRCERCGHPSDRYSCRWCTQLPPFVRSARSYCWIGPGTAGYIVHALKYDGWLRVAEGIAERLARIPFLLDVVEERMAIVPVPISAERRRERGFNQCSAIAVSLAPRWEIPVWDDVLVRRSSTISQTELTPAERQSNVAGAFAVNGSARDSLRGSHVVLLDDVVTTGATLGACASALFAGGARTISCVTFGRAPASGDRLSP